MTASTRKFTAGEAAEYLLREHNIRRTEPTLAKYRSVGGGPAYYKAGHRILYDQPDLDAWALALVGSPVRSTSEYPARVAA
jgi:hypothetical protein